MEINRRFSAILPHMLIPSFPEFTPLIFELKDEMQPKLYQAVDGVSEFTFAGLYMFHEVLRVLFFQRLGEKIFIFSGIQPLTQMMSGRRCFLAWPLPPVSGAVFYLDPSLPAESQALRVETTGFSSGALLFADGELLGSLNYAGVYALPLSRGRHSITVVDTEVEGSSASVDFEVR